MPELPEVETTLQGIAPYLINQKVKKVVVRNPNLRWPITSDISKLITGKKIIEISRRGKYIIVSFKEGGNLIIHLGMSGKLRVLEPKSEVLKHDHFEIGINNHVIRYNDPRRFGCVLWTDEPPFEHKLLNHLGVEPLSNDYNAEYMQAKSKSKKYSIKQFLMDGSIVVGIGNIYACEILFKAKINPQTKASNIGLKDYKNIVKYSKNILKQAIAQGGTTLKDFTQSDGNPGYFAQKLSVYGKINSPCPKCKNLIESIIIGQRNTFFCGNCQKLV